MTITGDRELERNGEKTLVERTKAVDAAILSIEKQFGRGSIMKLGSAERQSVASIPTGSIALDLALGVGGIPRGRITEIFGPGVVGQDHGLPARHRRGPGTRRRGRLHRRRACPRSGLRPGLRGQRRRAPGQPAGHRRAGARDHRDADPLGRGRLRRPRLGRGAGAAGGDRGRDGRLVRGDPGPADEPGAAQADRRRQSLEHLARLHQPAAREDRGHVRQPRR